MTNDSSHYNILCRYKAMYNGIMLCHIHSAFVTRSRFSEGCRLTRTCTFYENNDDVTT